MCESKDSKTQLDESLFPRRPRTIIQQRMIAVAKLVPTPAGVKTPPRGNTVHTSYHDHVVHVVHVLTSTYFFLVCLMISWTYVYIVGVAYTASQGKIPTTLLCSHMIRAATWRSCLHFGNNSGLHSGTYDATPTAPHTNTQHRYTSKALRSNYRLDNRSAV